MVDYYDQLLVAIVAALVAGAAASLHPAIALNQGLAGGSLLSTVFLYEILFRNPPVEPTRATSTASVIVGVGWLLTGFLAL
ncbi:MAG: hypothetical protein V5A30_04830 [Haloarculaceae archaeon]